VAAAEVDYDQIFRLAALVENHRDGAERIAGLAYRLSLGSEVEAAVDVDRNRGRVFGGVLFDHAFCVWTVADSA